MDIKKFCDEIFKEKLPLKEKQILLFTEIAKDQNLLKDYEYQHPPIKPEDLIQKENAYEIEVEKLQRLKSFGAVKDLNVEFHKDARTNFPKYFDSLSKNFFHNLSNLTFLKEMYEILNQHAPAYKGSVQQIIYTHEIR